MTRAHHGGKTTRVPEPLHFERTFAQSTPLIPGTTARTGGRLDRAMTSLFSQVRRCETPSRDRRCHERLTSSQRCCPVPRAGGHGDEPSSQTHGTEPFDHGLHAWSVWLCRLRITEQAGGHRERRRHRCNAPRQLPVSVRVIPRLRTAVLTGPRARAWTYLFLYSYSLSFMLHRVRPLRNARRGSPAALQGRLRANSATTDSARHICFIWQIGRQNRSDRRFAA